MADSDRHYTCNFYFERKARKQGFRVVAGADEAGRGCLFGAVYAAAAVLDPARPIRGLRTRVSRVGPLSEPVKCFDLKVSLLGLDAGGRLGYGQRKRK